MALKVLLCILCIDFELLKVTHELFALIQGLFAPEVYRTPDADLFESFKLWTVWLIFSSLIGVVWYERDTRKDVFLACNSRPYGNLALDLPSWFLLLDLLSLLYLFLWIFRSNFDNLFGIR